MNFNGLLYSRGTLCMLKTYWCVVLWAALAVTPAAGLEWDWVRRIEGGTSEGRTIGIDASLNVYVGGTFAGTNYLGTNVLTAQTGTNVFIAKLDPFGEPMWAISCSGVLRKLVVSREGAVFAAGNLQFEGASSMPQSSAYLARFDDGQLTWSRTSGGELEAGGIAFGPDGSLFVLLRADPPWIQRYSQDGTVLGENVIQLEPFYPIGISVGLGGEIVIGGEYRLPGSGSIVSGFVSRVLPSGETSNLKTTSSGYYFGKEVRAVAVTASGNLVVAGVELSSLPIRWAWVELSDSDGTELWRHGAGYRKVYYQPNDIAVDRRGFVHVVGDGAKWHAYQLWLMSVSPNGEQVERELVRSYLQRDENRGNAIACAEDGAIFVTGSTRGQAEFGTNRLGHVNGPACYIGRRSTIAPELTYSTGDDRITLSWPKAAYPVVLQRRDWDRTNWVQMDERPHQVGWTYKVVIAGTEQNTEYRLLRTNLPRQRPLQFTPGGTYIEGWTFLDRRNSVIAGPRSETVFRIIAMCDSDELDTIAVEWLDHGSGMQISTNMIAQAHVSGADDYSKRYPPMIQSIVTTDTGSFPVGRHMVSVTFSNGIFEISTNLTFEVVPFEVALQELAGELQPYSEQRDTRKAVRMFWQAQRALERSRFNVAGRWLRRFEKRLPRYQEAFGVANVVRFGSAVGRIAEVIE